ncbi:MAG: 3'-5' exonuclease [Cyanobacteria bacterium J06554_6]
MYGAHEADVDGAPPFQTALIAFKGWLFPFECYRFCSWGEYDRKQFQRDCQRHGVGYPFAGGHLNLKTAFSASQGLHRKLGLQQALDQLDLTFKGIPHRGLDDARNTAQVVCAVQSRKI